MWNLYKTSTYWIAHDLLAAGGNNGMLYAYSAEAYRKGGRNAETVLEVVFEDGTAEVKLLKTEYAYGDFEDYERVSKRLELCLSHRYGGADYSYTMIKENACFDKVSAEDDTEGIGYHGCTWQFRPNEPKAQALQFLDEEIHVTITGYYLDSEANYPLQYLPNVSHPERSLISMAILLGSSDAEYVLLAPSLPVQEKRTLRAHRRLLCESSSYFATLLGSDFAEAVVLRGRGQSLDHEASSERRRDDREDSGASMSSDKIPTVKINDITYEQLHTLLFYLHTGVAVFDKRRDSFIPHDNADICLDEPRPWWHGHLRPANAFDMYRLADKYDVQNLRLAALRFIATEISVSSLIQDAEEYEEITLFPEIAQIYREFCELHKKQIKTQCQDHGKIFSTFEVDPSATTQRKGSRAM